MNNSNKRETIPVLNCGEGFFGYAAGIREILKAYNIYSSLLFSWLLLVSHNISKKKNR
jgi:hypothetical protein